MPNQKQVHPRPNARVFMTNKGFHEYAPAERWGKIIPLTTGRVNLKNTDRLENSIQTKLDTMTENDYLCISGSPVLGVMAAGYVLLKFGYVDLLYWDALYMDYRYRRLTFVKKEVENDDEGTDGTNPLSGSSEPEESIY